MLLAGCGSVACTSCASLCASAAAAANAVRNYHAALSVALPATAESNPLPMLPCPPHLCSGAVLHERVPLQLVVM